MSILSRHLSNKADWGTPIDIVERARLVLGVIDLDPASNDVAQTRIRATRYFTKADNGYLMPWSGRVFLNPPGGWCDTMAREAVKASKRSGKPSCTVSGACGLPPGHEHDACLSSQKIWWERLAHHWDEGLIEAAIFICFSIELLQSTQQKPVGSVPLAFPICYPKTRVSYLDNDGKKQGSPPHASCIVYLPPIDVTRVWKFFEVFKSLGHVVIPRALPDRLVRRRGQGRSLLCAGI